MDWFWDNSALLLELTLEHARLSGSAIIAGFVLSIPLAQVARSSPATRTVMVTLFNILFTLPSLALFILLPLLLGTRILDDLNVVVALTLYSTAMMLRGAIDAFDDVDQRQADVARAVGYSPNGVFWGVRLPLAGPVLLAQMRVVSVSMVSLLSIAALIGKGGLGYLFTNGFQRDHPAEIGAGIVLILLLAFVFDRILVLAGRVLLPWSAAQDARGRTAAAFVEARA